MTELKSISFRLKPQTHERLRQMAATSNRTMVGALEGAVDAAWQTIYLPAIREAEERAKRGRKLVELLEERLGPRFWREDEATEVGFEPAPHGGVIVHAGAARYVDEGEGRVFKLYVKGGRIESAPVLEDGLGDWTTTPMGDPILN